MCNQRRAIVTCDWCEWRDGHSFGCPQLEYDRLMVSDAERIERFKLDEARLAEMEHRAGCMELEDYISGDEHAE